MRGENGAAGSSMQDVSGLPDLRIDVVGDLLVVDEGVDRAAERQRAVRVELVRPRAEARAPEQMLELTIKDKGHLVSPLPSPPATMLLEAAPRA